MLRLIEKLGLLRKMETGVGDPVFHKMSKEIRDEEEKYYSYVEDLLKLLLTELASGLPTGNVHLVKNLLVLVIKCYMGSSREKILNNKLRELVVSKLLDSAFESTNGVISRLDEFNTLITAKLGLYTTCLNTALGNTGPTHINTFNTTCIVLPLIDRLSSDKYIFNCVDYNLFRETLNSVLNFLIQYTQGDGITVDPKVKSFLSSFSFFTYFQFLQNDMCKVFIEEGMNSYENLTPDTDDNLDNFIKKLMVMSNLNFNVTRMLEEVFRDRKLFYKILPNFMTFLIQINKFFISRQLEIIESENMKKVTNLISEPGFSFEDSNMLELRRNLFDYIGNLDNYLYFYTETLGSKLKQVGDLFIFSDEDVGQLQRCTDDIIKGLVNTIRTLTEADGITAIVTQLDLRAVLSLKAI
jgi:hypothetical protein